MDFEQSRCGTAWFTTAEIPAAHDQCVSGYRRVDREPGDDELAVGLLFEAGFDDVAMFDIGDARRWRHLRGEIGRWSEREQIWRGFWCAGGGGVQEVTGYQQTVGSPRTHDTTMNHERPVQIGSECRLDQFTAIEVGQYGREGS
ncbi:hypothetical protein [Nocardia vaccinii]|uniref:hypothetical protein n=1 Tax=Nocardia vaccinii TaxID=1822 RepID=UPI0012F5056F|nr:hypothetical protein [Nocardia vaccinii]